jgi:hypothetical protein
MATYTVTFKQVVNNVCTIETLTANEIVVGQTVTISDMGAPFNGAHIVTATPTSYFIYKDDIGDYVYNPSIIIQNQIQFPLVTDNVSRIAASGTITYAVATSCTWISLSDLEDWLGFVFVDPSSDRDLGLIAVASANTFGYRRRASANYFDSLTVLPDQACKMALMMMAGALYRERGSIDQYASFDPLATGAVTGGSMGQILRLLGCNRPAVA